MRIVCWAFTLWCLSYPVWAQSPFDKMTNDKMDKVIRRLVVEYEGAKGNWKLSYKNRTVFIITDEPHNRMRIISPVTEEKEVPKDGLKTLLEANFDRALDAKYSLYKGYVWSIFTHPLGELSVEQFKDALNQVVVLADNYGGSYTSTDLVFGGSEN